MQHAHQAIRRPNSNAYGFKSSFSRAHHSVRHAIYIICYMGGSLHTQSAPPVYGPRSLEPLPLDIYPRLRRSLRAVVPSASRVLHAAPVALHGPREPPPLALLVADATSSFSLSPNRAPQPTPAPSASTPLAAPPMPARSSPHACFRSLHHTTYTKPLPGCLPPPPPHRTHAPRRDLLAAAAPPPPPPPPPRVLPPPPPPHGHRHRRRRRHAPPAPLRRGAASWGSRGGRARASAWRRRRRRRACRAWTRGA